MGLAPGRELDALVAEKVMGLGKRDTRIRRARTNTADFPNSMSPEGEYPVRPYSTDIAAAWEVVEKLGIRVWPTEDNRWYAAVSRFDTTYGDEYWFGGRSFMDDCGDLVADTAPYAICLAALDHVGVAL